MRDDIENILLNITTLCQQKHQLLQKIHTNCKNKHYYLKTDNIDSLNESFKKDKDLYERHGILEFEINNLRRKICKIAGIDVFKFENYFLNMKEKSCIDLKEILHRIENLLFSLEKDNEDLIIKMEKRLGTLKVDIDSLSALQRWHSYKRSIAKK